MYIRFFQFLILFLFSFYRLYSQHYAIKSIVGGRIEVNKELEAKADYSLISNYKPSIDSLMSPILGKSNVFMDASRPESLLSNWVADVMVNKAMKIDWDVDFGLCNIGGLRSSMPKGEVTAGDIMSIAPFENTLCLLSVKGKDLLELLKQIAKSGGEGVSSSLRITIDTNGTLMNASVKGKRIRKSKVYNIVTLDYLAEGNDGMSALKHAIKRVDTSFLIRNVLMDYIKEQSESGNFLDSKIEGRIVVMP